MPGPLDFLSGPPAPVVEDLGGPIERPLDAESLPQPVIDRLMGLDGVDGVWMERDSCGERVVVLHYSPSTHPRHLPGQVEGMAVKIVGGDPIRAQS
jgi:hypothetical protein